MILAAESDAKIDLDPCQLCGRTIDEHFRVDTFDGQILLCDDGPGDRVRQWELADPRDRWRHTGEAPPSEIVRNSAIGIPMSIAARPYRTPQSTIDAFWFVARQDDPDRLKSWLLRHPSDAPALCKLWEGKNAKA
jgi:hypothetical protein